MPLVKFEFELEFLTPAFIGGADPARKADFTLKPLKSAMRYWWRQTQDWYSTTTLFDRESTLFGSTRNRSPFRLQLKAGSWELPEGRSANAKAEGRLQPVTGYYNPDGRGMSYLLYSCRGCRQWFDKGYRFRFFLTFTSSDESAVRQILLSLWLAQTFGGLGGRSRKGAGSFEVTPKEWPDGFGLVQELFPRTAKDLQEFFKPPVDVDSDHFFRIVSSASPLAAAMKEADRFGQFGADETPEALLNTLGENLQKARTCPRYKANADDDPRHVQAWKLHLAGLAAEANQAQGKAPQDTYPESSPIPKTAFGLPIVFNFKQRDAAGMLVTYSDRKDRKEKVCPEPWQIVLRPQEHDRRASPLFLCIKRDRITLKHYANLLVLWNEFLPTIDDKKESIGIYWQPRKKNKPHPCKESPGGGPQRIGTLEPPGMEEVTKFIRRHR